MSIRVSWWLLNAELLLTINAAQAIMTLFCLLSVGMTQGEVGILEAVCSVVYLLFNIPTGWIADRVNRKICNILGDFCYGISLIMLGNAADFMDVIVARTIMAFGNSCSQGADEALFKAHCNQLGKDYVDTKKRMSLVKLWVSLGYYAMGGIITALYGMKTTMLLASIPLFMAAAVSCFIKELGVHKNVSDRPSPMSKTIGEFKELKRTIRFVLHEDPRLSWLLIAAAVATVMGGPIMGLVGPIITSVGGSESLAGAAHVAISLASICAGWLSRRVFNAWDARRLFLVMSSVSLSLMALAGLHLTAWTAAIQIVGVQVVRVLLMHSLNPLAQEAAPNEIQSTVSSLKSSVSELLYIVVVLVINFAADYGIQWGIAANVLIFAPIVLVTLKRPYKKDKNA